MCGEVSRKVGERCRLHVLVRARDHLKGLDSRADLLELLEPHGMLPLWPPYTYLVAPKER